MAYGDRYIHLHSPFSETDTCIVDSQEPFHQRPLLFCEHVAKTSSIANRLSVTLSSSQSTARRRRSSRVPFNDSISKAALHFVSVDATNIPLRRTLVPTIISGYCEGWTTHVVSCSHTIQNELDQRSFFGTSAEVISFCDQVGLLIGE
jgi:hypothetical protein